MDVYTFIILLHIVGTVLGAGGATIAEVQIHKALRDGKVTADEGALLHSNYFLIRVGTGFILLSVLAMAWYHWHYDSLSMLLGTKVIFKEFLVVIIIANAVAISNRWVPLWLGAAVSFTSWWAATILGVAGPISVNFLTFLFGYVVAVGIVAVVLQSIKRLFAPKSQV